MFSFPLRRPRFAEQEVHDLLSSPRRRAALRLIRRHGRLDVAALAEAVATAETGADPAPRTVRESVYNSLQQTHLPKLAALGLVAIEDREVRALGRMREVARYSTMVTRHGITWAEYYRTLGIVALFLVVASLTGVPVIEALDPLIPATVALVVFAASSAYQLWTEWPGRFRSRW